MPTPRSTRNQPESEQQFMQSLLGQDEYSDLTIKCGNDVHRVHKVILCSQSDLFAAMCKGEFKEAQTREINLPADDPDLVQIMIYHLYRHSYAEAKAKVAGPESNDPLLDLAMYTLADKYGLQRLEISAENSFRDWAKKTWSTPEFHPVVEQTWDTPHLVRLHRHIEEVIADHAKELCSPVGHNGESLVGKGLARKMFTENFILRILPHQTAQTAQKPAPKRFVH